MKLFFATLIAVVFYSCEQDCPPIDTDKKIKNNILINAINKIPSGSYSTAKTKCLTKKNELALKYNNATTKLAKQQIINEAKNILTEQLVNTIIPFWYGTKWSFDGYTSTPTEGEIACGYFVSTTLKDMGFNLNRYKLAQQRPDLEAKSIQLSDSIEMIDNMSANCIKDYFIKYKVNGVYFVGLDSHVGYLLKTQNELFFIHSNYINSTGVVIETTENSRAFSSNVYYIADITNNNQLIEKWLLNETIMVRKK